MFDMEIEAVAAAPVAPGQTAGNRATAEVGERLATITNLTYPELRVEWRRLYRAHPPRRISRDLLELGVAWKLQEKALGGLGASTRRRIAELAQTMATRGDLVKARAVTLRPGASLVREWHGDTHEVLVLEDGYRWRGEHWRSLSAIARAITGTQWSGPRFFGLQKGADRALCPAGAAPPDTDLLGQFEASESLTTSNMGALESAGMTTGTRALEAADA